MLNKIFAFVLVLNVTGLYRFFAPQLGISIGQVSFAMLAFNVVYLWCKYPRSNFLLKRMRLWFIVVVVWPLLTLVYAPAIDLRQIGLMIYGLTLFAGAGIYTVSNGLRSMRRVFSVSLIVTIFGQILNMWMPSYFERVANLADARALSLGRPGGFYMQPNALAIGLCLIFLTWLSLARRDTVVREPVTILVFLLSILLTGSRTGVILGALIVVLHFGYQSRKNIFSSLKFRYLSTRLLVFAICIFIGMVGVSFFVQAYGRQIERKSGDLIDRIDNLLSFRLSDDDLLQEGSLVERFSTQKVILRKIEDSPIVGYGFGSEAFFLDRGNLYLSSHSTLLSMTLEYGIFYPIFFAALLGSLFLNRNRKSVEAFLGTNMVTQFVTIALIIFFTAGELLGRREFCVVFGLVFAVVHYPWVVSCSGARCSKIS